MAGMATAVLLSGAVVATAADARPTPGAAEPTGPGGGERGHGGYPTVGPAVSPTRRPVVDDRPSPPVRPPVARPLAQRPAARPEPVRAQPPMVLRAGRVSAARAVTAADVSSGPASSVPMNVLILVNERRRRAGCGPLSLDRRLTDAAGEHAADMARHGYFAHASRNGDDPGDRVRDAGFRWRRYGENIARGASSPDQVVRDWMRSPEHRENILDCRLREMGIGLAMSRRRGAYWVQDFATP